MVPWIRDDSIALTMYKISMRFTELHALSGPRPDFGQRAICEKLWFFSVLLRSSKCGDRSVPSTLSSTVAAAAGPIASAERVR